MPASAVKPKLSPATNPLPIDTVALARSPPLSTSLTVSAPSSVAAAPPVKVAVAPAVTLGATCTVSTVPVAVALVPLLVLPSFTTTSMVRVVSLPPPVGSPLLGLKL